MRFFKKLGKKTVMQGMSAWALYKIFYLLNSFFPEELNNDANQMFEKFIEHAGIPILATIGYEDIYNRITGEPYNLEATTINLLGTFITSTLTSVTSPHMPTDIVVPLSLFAFGVYYFYFVTDEELFRSQQQEESLQESLHRRL